MTRKQRKQRGQISPKRGKHNSTREQYLLRELQRIGWQVNAVGPYQFFISRKVAV